MIHAIILGPEEKAIAERQCVGCFRWDWFKGCYWPDSWFPQEPKPKKNCGSFDPGLRSV